ncbi:type II toxin-antitoxin system RatA family toxin [Saccharothrix sp. NRRL B-16314]|uniref:type II toxin-antitoxin system RatA family toxin n=1 Tax=Saccharothrix sp. NRRL B-16314 TaxID=1463825 RepID=UPI000526895B|nr:SRPBCC family protein [Saccharothrix sp. NRRL B-16314]
MQTVTVEAVVPDWQAADVYERLKDSDVYVKYAPEQVKSVVTEAVDEPGEAITHWEIFFRNGLLRWSERDYFDDEKCTIRFEQVSGDFDVFEGDWVVSTRDGDVLLTFTAHFDFGVPSLEAIIEPVAIRVLRQAMSRIIGKLFDGVVLA